jgi:hypothetical protein
LPSGGFGLLRVVALSLLSDPSPPQSGGLFHCVLYLISQMGIDFRACLYVANPSQDEPTVIPLAYLGNGDIKRAMYDLLTKDEDGFPTPGGSIPIDEGTPAFEALDSLLFDVDVDLEILKNRLEDAESDRDDDKWHRIYQDFRGTKDHYDVLNDTVNAIKASSGNPSITCEIGWW